MMRAHEISKESLIAEAEEVRVRAMAAGDMEAAVAAIREIGILSGLRVERVENVGHFDLED